MNRAGFTMIELIFVIVIIGILATIAIPRLAATRDDARTSIETSNLATCITDLGSQYTGQQSLDVSAVASCDSAFSRNCFSNATQANGILIISAGSNTDGWCVEAQTLATNQGLIATHTFGGTSVIY